MWRIGLRLCLCWRSLSRLSSQAECMVHALFLPLWPLARMAMWLLLSFMATVFYKEAMVWLSGRFLRVTAWRQFFNLTATIFGGEKWSLVAYALPCMISAVWDLVGPFYNSSSVEDDDVSLFSEALDFEWEPPASPGTFLGCDPVVGAGAAIVTALGLWMSRLFHR